MKPSEVLDKAAQVQALYGHCKGTLHDQEGRLCLQGAMMLAAGGTFSDHDSSDLRIGLDTAAFERAHLFVRCCLPEATHVWNDRSETTVDDVVRVFREAAEVAREAGE